jgi:uracil-DNA glycosylase family 4
MSLKTLQTTIIQCTRCPRLVAYRKQVAQDKVRRFRHESYWGKPVPSFGDTQARLLLIGLAPAAHGANRTGRAFTGDRSGAWLYDALHTYGFANQPTSEHRGDGLKLRDCYITQVLHCAPPDNKPARDEMAQCQSYMLTELALLPHLQVVVPLGQIAFDAYIRACQHLDILPDSKPRFGHGLRYILSNGLTLMPSYHPSQQNTQTGRLTRAMFHGIFSTARHLLSSGTRHQPKMGLTTSPQQR